MLKYASMKIQNVLSRHVLRVCLLFASKFCNHTLSIQAIEHCIAQHYCPLPLSTLTLIIFVTQYYDVLPLQPIIKQNFVTQIIWHISVAIKRLGRRLHEGRKEKSQHVDLWWKKTLSYWPFWIHESLFFWLELAWKSVLWGSRRI